jgi:hypothetical protein
MERRRVRMLMAPRTWDTPDAKGFLAYAKQHYKQALEMAAEICSDFETWPTRKDIAFQGILDKLAAPLIYLYESWEVLAPEEKAKYSPELAEIHKKSVAMAEQLAPGVPAVKPAEAKRVPGLDLAEIEALPWTSYKTKKVAAAGEAAWVWRSLENARELGEAIERSEGQHLQLGDMEYKFSGPEKQFISRRPVRV